MYIMLLVGGQGTYRNICVAFRCLGMCLLCLAAWSGGMLLSTAGPSAVIAVIGYAGILALARNPASAPKVQLTMILAFVFAEAIAIIALLLIFHLYAVAVVS